MRIMLLVMFILTSNVFAGEFIQRKITVDFIGDHNGNRIYYRCDVAREMLETQLVKLGAQAVQTTCSGGLERYGYSPYWAPMTVRATFEVAATGTHTAKEVVELNADDRAHEDCFLSVAMVEEALPLIPGVKVLKKKNSCMHNESRWSYTVEVSK